MINVADIDRLCDELVELIAVGPGRDDAALRRVKEITSEIHDHSTTGHTRSMLVELTTDLSVWFSHHKWHHYGPGGERLRSMLIDSVGKLRSAWRSLESET